MIYKKVNMIVTYLMEFKKIKINKINNKTPALKSLSPD